MKLSFLFMVVSALLLAGCTRERVVERPVIIAPAATGATAAACVYASQAYAHGSATCQDRMQYQCDNGVWNRTANAC